MGVISKRGRSAIVAAVAAVTLTGAASAGTLYWDGNGAATGAGAAPTGTWGVDPFWTPDANGEAATVAWLADELAVFSAGADAVGPFIVTVDGTQSTSGITFEEGDVTLTGGTLNLTGTGGVTVTAPTAAINSVVGGSVGLTKLGAGRLTLGGANTFSGTVTVSEGTLAIPSDAPTGVLGTVGVLGPSATVANNTAVSAGATLEITGNYNGGDQLFLAGNGVGGGGALRKVGNNTTTISGKGITLNGSTGARITAAEGELVLSNSSMGRNVASPAPTLTIDGAGNLRTTAAADGGNFNISIGNSRLVKEGAGILTLGSSNAWTGGTTIKNGTVRFSADVTGTGSQQLGATPAYAADNIILDGGTLEATNTATITTNSNRGMQIGANGGTVRTSAAITIFGAPIGIVPGTTGDATLTKVGPGEFRYNANATNTRTQTGFTKLVVKEGLFRLGFITGVSTELGFGAAPASFKSDAIVLDGGSIGTSYNAVDNVLHVNRGITLGPAGGTLISAFTIPGAITGPGNLTVTGGSSVVIVQSPNTYTGKTNVIAGATYAIPADSGLGDVPAAPLADSVTLGNTTTTGNLRFDGNANLHANRGIVLNGGTSINVVGAANESSVAGVISGTGSLTKTGPGTLTLSGTNTYSGTTTSFAGGVLAISSDANLGTAPGAPLATSLNLGGATTGGTLRATATTTLNANRGVNLNAGGADPATGAGGTIDVVSGETLTVPGVVSGAGRFTKSGAGTLVLGAANTYGISTTVSGGTLVAGNPNAFGTGTLTVADGATARVQAGLPQALSLPAPLGITATGATGGTLDQTDGALVVRHADQAAALAGHATVNGLVRNAFNEFAWNQPGITSSTVAADVAAGIPAAVGILLNNDGGGGALFYGDGTALPQFEGRSVDSNSVLTKSTLLGDGDLNGTVDSVDFALFQAGYTGAAPYIGFAFGDYDYNGVIDSVDFGLFQAGYEYSQSNPTPEMIAFAGEHHLSLVAAAVPEPTTFGLLALAAGGLLTRRRVRRGDAR